MKSAMVEYPSPEDALFQVWLKLAQWFWSRRSLNVINVFLLYGYYSTSFWKKGVPPFKQT